MLKFFLICLVLFLVVRLVQSYSRPVADKYSSNKDKFNKKEGKITVDITRNDKKRIPDDEGEYIDYEEV